MCQQCKTGEICEPTVSLTHASRKCLSRSPQTGLATAASTQIQYGVSSVEDTLYSQGFSTG